MSRRSLKGWESTRKRLTVACRAHWSERERGGAAPTLSLAAVESMCTKAGCPEECTRVQAMCSTQARRGTKKGTDKPTPQQLRKERQVVANWISATEVTNQRASVMQKVTAKLAPNATARTATCLASAGVTTSVRQGYRDRKQTVNSYHQRLEAQQQGCVQRVLRGSGTACSWLDDCTVFRIHQSMNSGAKRAITTA